MSNESLVDDVSNVFTGKRRCELLMFPEWLTLDGDCGIDADSLFHRLADCIENLEGAAEELGAKLTLTGEHLKTVQAERDELKAKLEKAVEEAEKYQKAFAAQSRKLQAVLHIEGVRATLAELTGGKDESV